MCKFSIRGPKRWNVSTANNEGKLYSNTLAHCFCDSNVFRCFFGNVMRASVFTLTQLSKNTNTKFKNSDFLKFDYFTHKMNCFLHFQIKENLDVVYTKNKNIISRKFKSIFE